MRDLQHCCVVFSLAREFHHSNSRIYRRHRQFSIQKFESYFCVFWFLVLKKLRIFHGNRKSDKLMFLLFLSIVCSQIIIPPLQTQSNQLIDKNGNVVKLYCVNWYCCLFVFFFCDRFFNSTKTTKTKNNKSNKQTIINTHVGTVHICNNLLSME